MSLYKLFISKGVVFMVYLYYLLMAVGVFLLVRYGLVLFNRSYGEHDPSCHFSFYAVPVVLLVVGFFMLIIGITLSMSS